MDFDPYQPPATSDGEPRDIPALTEMVKAWEKLRGLYNLIMLVAGIGVLALWLTLTDIPLPAAIFFGVFVGLGANAAFFLGPLAELYIRVFFLGGAPIGKGRQHIFNAGLAVSAGVILISALIPTL